MIKGLRKKTSSSKKDKKCSECDRMGNLSENERREEYLRIAEVGWTQAWDIYHSEGWKLTSGGGDLHTGCMYTRHAPEGGKIFKLEGYVDATPEQVFDQLVYGDNDSPAWNPTVLMCKTVEKINSNTDVAYNVAAPGAGGLVSSRDFVNLRHWKTKNDLTLSLGLSVCHPEVPPTHKYVRAVNRPAAWGFKQENGHCLFTLILKTDLKGWLPHYLVDQAMTGCLVNYIKYLKDRMLQIHTKSHLPQQINNKTDGVGFHSTNHTDTQNGRNTHIPEVTNVNNVDRSIGDTASDSDSDSSDFESCDDDADLNERMKDLDMSRVSEVSR